MKQLFLVFTFLLSTSVFADIEWKTYSDEALAQAKSDGKKVVLGFHKKGCGTCHAQDSALDEAGITKAENVVYLKVQRKNSDHKKVYEQYGFSSRQWAAIVLLNKEGKEVARVNPGVTSGKEISGLTKRAM